MASTFDPTESTILRGKFGRYWRAWWWLRLQWSVTSLATLGAVIIGIGGWAMNLKTRVVILETEVLPVLEESKREQVNSERIEALDGRVSRVERNIDLELNEQVRLEQLRHRK